MNLLRPDRIRSSVPTGPVNDQTIIAGYSDEMLTGAIESLSRVKHPGKWERKRLKVLQAEKSRRGAPKVRARRCLDLVPCKDR